MDLPFEADDEPLMPSVLVVDDEPLVLDVFTHLLARETDLSVATAESAEQALSVLRDRRFDLLITDKNLPGMGGIELIASARKLRPAIEAMVITGYASAESVLAALAAGASDYLRKPFDDLAVVRAKIRAALVRRADAVASRAEARRVAREAAALLARGKLVPDPIWQALEGELARYEAAPREPAAGSVRVVASPNVVARLREAGLQATLASSTDPALASADVVVLDMNDPGWRETADRLAGQPPDVVLLARADADVGDLLDALSLHLDLAGFGATRSDAQGTVASRAHALLERRRIGKSQESLTKALEAFRHALEKA